MEKKTAKDWGGRVQPGSGSKPMHKGDVKTDTILFDDKYTDKLSYTVTQKDLVKLCQEAMQERNRVPAFKIRFDAPVEDMRWFSKEWVLVPASFLQELLDERRT